MWKNYLVITIIILLFGINIFFVFKNTQSEEPVISTLIVDSEEENRAYILPISGPNYIPILDTNVVKPNVEAKAAVIYDTRSSRFLYEKNSQEKLPIASLTKILSAVVVLENMNLDNIVTITENSLRVDGEKQDLYLGEKLSIRNLLKLMLIESSNDAAYALAEHANEAGVDFVKTMNEKAVEIGMTDSSFVNPAGLDDNAYSTIQDLIKLVNHSLTYKEIWDISSEKTAIIESSDAKIQHTAVSTNRLLGLIQDIIGGKTGYTEGAGECMILVKSIPGYPSNLVSIVLGSSDRFGDTQKLINWTHQAYRWR